MKTESEIEKLSTEETAVDDREKEGRRTIIYGALAGIWTRVGRATAAYTRPDYTTRARIILLLILWYIFYLSLCVQEKFSLNTL